MDVFSYLSRIDATCRLLTLLAPDNMTYIINDAIMSTIIAAHFAEVHDGGKVKQIYIEVMT